MTEQKISGFLEILFRDSDATPITKVEDINWKDYVMVWGKLPIAEFEDPVEVLECLCESPPRFGMTPRRVQAGDIIHMCSNNRGWGNILMMVVDMSKPELKHLHRKGCVMMNSMKARGLGLIQLQRTMTPFTKQ